jgi:DNA-directed RNA polymerase II subunit RPB2
MINNTNNKITSTKSINPIKSIQETQSNMSNMSSKNNESFDMRNEQFIEQPWTIIESYFKDKHLERLVRHQLESYNNFVGHQLVKTIEMFNPVRIASELDYDAASGKFSFEMYITFENFHIYRPQIHENNGATKVMFPQEARLRNFTYSAAMTLDINIKYVIRSGENLENAQTFYKTLQKIHIGKLPIMLKSNICVLNQYKYIESTYTGECKYDSGGYFIINGSEKTVLGQERAAENKIYCFNVSKNNTKYSWIAEVKSIPDHKCISPKQINMMISSKNNGFGCPITIQIPRIKQAIPLFIVFRALGVISDKSICEKILLDVQNENHKEMLSMLQASIIEANKYLTEEESVRYITTYAMYTPINMDKETGNRKKHEFTLEILRNDLFPHCSTVEQKVYFMGIMTYKLLQAFFEKTKQDDRDSYINKRIDLTGASLNNLFRNYFNKLVKDMEKQVIKEINNGSWRSTDDYENIINQTNIYKIVKSTTIENGFKRALSTGDFGIKHTNSNKVGVAQVLNRLTYVSSLSHLRRISTPTDKSGKLIPPRKLHNTTWGFLCPAETPEGQSVGIVKNLSYMSHVSIHSNSLSLYDYILPIIIKVHELSPIDLFDKVKVFINGTWVGVTETPLELYTDLKTKKHKGIINIYTSVVFDYKNQEIRVCNDSGRIMRPLFRVKNNQLLLTPKIVEDLEEGILTWDDLFTDCKTADAVLEYIDPEEQSFSMVAMKITDLVEDKEHLYKYTHCEIHPSTLFGVLASCIPFPEHNQSPRNTYQCAMGKQSMGVYVTNYLERMDKTAYVLNYPTRPLVDTRIMSMIKLNEIPSGCNINVAIMTHTGYNQEDSLLVNQGSIDRGLFQATIYHTEKDEDKQKINGDEEIRCKPDASKTKGMKFGNYNKVNSKGVIPENSLVENRDIIISKVTPIKENRNDHTKVIKYEDQSKIFRTAEEVYIDKNYIDRNGDGYSFAKVRLRAVRKPVIGDKFSSRHGQKGTVGNIIPEKDMPFTSNGTRPDIIINPHAIPSRMTIGQLKETLLGKVLVELGLFGDGTSFGEFDIKTISEKLLNLGYEANGNEILYNGLTGEQIECNVFMGPVFYQRLKHMVSDKTHSRSIGPMVNLTRQPAEGRSRDGGLRFGEMERDCNASGSPLTLSCGLSVKIEHMEFCDHEVLGWSEEKNGMLKSKQIGFLNKGERECIELTFEDGRKITCTGNHPILTSNNEWVYAQDLIVNESRVKTSVTCPVIDIQEEINECAGWQLNVGTITLLTNTRQEYFKTLAFMRLLGYLMTDGGIYINKGYISGQICLGHLIDVETCLNDLRLFCEITQNNFMNKNYYYITLPLHFLQNILTIKGVQTGKKICQAASLPAFILDENCPKPIVREFLGGMFGGDGHTCYLGLHRGKRDLLTSVSFSKSKNAEHVESLQQMMVQLQHLLSRCGIHKTTIQAAKETTYSKNKKDKTKTNSFQVLLHIDIDYLVAFSEQIGFRYCCHKSQRLEAGVSYKRLRTEVTRQHNWIVDRVDQLTQFSKIKKEFPNKIVSTKNAIIQATNELRQIEPLIHEYAIPSTHDITDHLIKGTKFGKFASDKFPNAQEFMERIDAVDWFLNQDIEPVKYEDECEVIDEEENSQDETKYGVSRNMESIPTMNLRVIDIRPVGLKQVYDIEVENTHSFLANGVVAHNCMISHGAARFTRGRLYDASDKYSVNVCKKCGLIAAYNDKLHIHHCKTCDNRTDFAYVEIPYACKLLFQELITMNVAPRIMTDH